MSGLICIATRLKPYATAENGSKLFAVINIIAASTVLGLTIQEFSHYNQINEVMLALKEPGREEEWNDTILLHHIFSGLDSMFELFPLKTLEIIKVALGLFIIALAFSIILAIGNFMRRPGCIMAYLIYGANIIVISMVLIVVIGANHEMESKNYCLYIFSSIMLYFVYSLVLRMLWVNYKKMTANGEPSTPILDVEPVACPGGMGIPSQYMNGNSCVPPSAPPVPSLDYPLDDRRNILQGN
ncbi:hypothetical protein O0L34_g13889 [Tuta absoluta]|nr:hypothetical protein O0L34_g13889 [Tuta absoluta]